VGDSTIVFRTSTNVFVWSLLQKFEKFQKKQNPSIFLATYWKSSSKSGDLEIVFFEIWRILGHLYLSASKLHMQMQTAQHQPERSGSCNFPLQFDPCRAQ
jgi:membrane associated rhomboid family serine protease